MTMSKQSQIYDTLVSFCGILHHDMCTEKEKREAAAWFGRLVTLITTRQDTAVSIEPCSARLDLNDNATHHCLLVTFKNGPVTVRGAVDVVLHNEDEASKVVSAAWVFVGDDVDMSLRIERKDMHPYDSLLAVDILAAYVAYWDEVSRRVQRIVPQHNITINHDK